MTNYSITTYKGTELDPFKHYDIKVIAKGLARTGRFSGQGNEFYSVAQHSVLLSNIVWDEGHTYGVSLCALLHDSPDFILGDIATPLRKHPKMMIYNVVYENILHNFLSSVGLKEVTSMLESISPLDKRLALTEATALGIDTTNWTDPQYHTEAYDILVSPIWTCRHAEIYFLNRFNYLIKVLQTDSRNLMMFSNRILISNIKKMKF